MFKKKEPIAVDSKLPELVICEKCTHAFDKSRRQEYITKDYNYNTHVMYRCPNCTVAYEELHSYGGYVTYWKKFQVEEDGTPVGYVLKKVKP
jgi:hypothetical protein